MENISPHISYQEAIRSETATRLGLDNRPNKKQLASMKIVANTCFEPARTHFGGLPIYVSSFIRVPLVNKYAGGSATSFHPLGQAIDLDADVFKHQTNKEIFDFFYYGGAPYTELIWEYGTTENPAWVHVAYNPKDPRQMVKRMFWNDDKRTKELFDLY